MSSVKSSNLGYPRIGEKREWKKALEQFWAGKLEKDIFLQEIEALRLGHLKKQRDAGIELIPVGDFSLYDHVLDTATMFGLVPKRFDYDGGPVSLETYFDIARGTKGAVASTMTKWFNTNYHYIVPELEECTPALVENRPLQFYKEAKQKLNIEGKPVILGPVTFVKLSKGYKKNEFKEIVEQFVPLYATILAELQAEGVEWVQIDEPILSTTLSKEDLALYTEVYQTLKEAAPDVKVILQTYFDSVDHYKEVVSLPVEGIGLDFVHDRGENLTALNKYGFPSDKVLAAGVIDGRNIWRENLDEQLLTISEIEEAVSKDRLILQPSSSLLHVPVTVKNEETIDPVLKNALSFADEKLKEITLLAKAVQQGKEAIEEEISVSKQAIQALNGSSFRNHQDVQKELKQLHSYKAERQAPFDVRQRVQQEAFQLPLLPTTTIGSFPQTKEVRKERLKWRKGELSDEAYEAYINEEIKKWIEIQENIGLDVLVHGEFERTDMVEYFGEKLGGFQFTKFGWVQSYGSRCVKPPLIYGDVSYEQAMTIKETVYAQSLTNKPVKGMLTGPITILNWSFVRDDIPRYDVANQIALALRKEVEALESQGISMIQVDEPALREGLPLKRENWNSYLNAAVYAFKLATVSVQNETQIHTHMCYSEFEEIIDAIKALDADVISIETSKSHGELIYAFEKHTYNQGIGLGVYDIHSPRVPKLEELQRNIDRALKVLDPALFWINPDCGLKTRGISETVEALKVMVESAKQTRKNLLQNV
ncbi:5-methyltetrahydropteroyltriglutamate--homocysteine S-methyltransferase [Priestia megaterium]|uniref:5-methyltetrahydropteroyltriglutamate-- homocysteine S-methyltransferase n=1 Tax=Priestia megaterium TaxID=1404 RepID=UPI000BF50F1C|nr:5-methyltetrahydropteroyltriglutamate--homocysteine S-methyltransferase [Priestia megaterium]PFK03265.1 5-methyltetrahydropteroyltriglutamate--homocysteine S-methyltransferase [Priestia megaterium]PMD10614.1 5-methyltetrahydropteroyltriglutamate--homocysteine S-methyltransferase [Priestia megaterium]TJZ36620.1 5-methyltetrahydropteroyltriglutamate--homocysteine S-methyltransferase [Priestia megaterium]